MKKVLVSACLLGERVRYDGGAKPVSSPILARWLAEGRVLSFCPEVAGGLPTPRPPAELQRDGRVVDAEGRDRSSAFHEGARRALELMRGEGAVLAVLKDGSPSCGATEVYDGTFSKRRVAGEGVTARLLRSSGLRVFNELELEAADAHLRSL